MHDIEYTAQKIKFFIKSVSIKLTKSAVSCGFGHIYCRHLLENFIFCAVIVSCKQIFNMSVAMMHLDVN